MKKFTLKSHWGKDYIFIENFPYIDVSRRGYEYDKVFDARDASEAQKFTKEMLNNGFAGKTFAYQDVIDWCKKQINYNKGE